MPSLRQTKSRMKSVQTTAKLTKAMQSVAAMRLRKFQKQLVALNKYTQVLTQNLNGILSTDQINLETFNTKDAQNKTLVILISPARGFCGGLHRKVIAETYQNLIENEKIDPTNPEQVDLVAINKPSKKGIARLGGQILAFYAGPFKELNAYKIMSVSELVKQLWLKGNYNKILVAFAKPTASLMGKVSLKQILPFVDFEKLETPTSSEIVLENFVAEFLEQWLEMEIHSAILQTQIAEEGARTVAMSGANTNANKLGQKLKLSYAKQRQAKITQEVSEIIGGSF